MSRWKKMYMDGKKKMFGYLTAAAGCGAILLGSGFLTPVTAFASEVTEAGEAVEENVLEENASDSGQETAGRVIGGETGAGDAESPAFSIEGNAEVVDHITDGSSKEFYTIRTANNQTFYLVIDHSNTMNNVYMLSAIDENDLQDFIEEESMDSGVLLEPSEAETETNSEDAGVIEEEISSDETEEIREETQKQEEQQSGNWKHLAGAGIGAAILAAVFWFVKRKQEKAGKKEEASENIEYGGQEAEEEIYEPDDVEDDFEDMDESPDETAEDDPDDRSDEAYGGIDEPPTGRDRNRT